MGLLRDVAQPVDRWVLVPIKAFDAAKGRLGVVLGDDERVALVTSMAAHVLDEAAPLPTCVACDDAAVARFAESKGAHVSWTPGLGLNGAVEASLAHLASLGAAFVTVVHADLPRARGIGEIEHFEGVTIASDRRGDGTNLLRVPANVPFTMQYGAGSFKRHLTECDRLGLAILRLDRDDLAFDVDDPEDLADLRT